MTSEPSLFGDEPEETPAEPTASMVPKWQVDLLRKALDNLGLGEMTQRQAMIEKLSGRSVASLQELTQEEAFLVLKRLTDESGSSKSGGSGWDDRDGPTWIDNL